MGSYSDRAGSTSDGSLRCATSYDAARAPSISLPSARKLMIRRYGIDTSILVRLLTGDPAESFERCVAHLSALSESGEVFASNQVIGEAYIAVQHHYDVGKADAREGLETVLKSGLVAPLSGKAVFEALAKRSGCGLLDRLITLGYSQQELETLTLDQRMASLPGARHLG